MFIVLKEQWGGWWLHLGATPHDHPLATPKHKIYQAFVTQAIFVSWGIYWQNNHTEYQSFNILFCHLYLFIFTQNNRVKTGVIWSTHYHYWVFSVTLVYVISARTVRQNQQRLYPDYTVCYTEESVVGVKLRPPLTELSSAGWHEFGWSVSHEILDLN